MEELLAKVSEAARSRHLSRRTETAYIHWARRFILRAGPDPSRWELSRIAEFLSALALESNVAAATQNQALHALLFLFKDVLGRETGYLNGIVRAKTPERLPVVLGKDEVVAILRKMDGAPKLMSMLLYGAGLRLMECCQLRVKDVDFSQNQLVVRCGKGGKDRYTMLPSAAREALRPTP